VTDIDKDIDIMVAGKLIRNAKLLYAINKGARVVSLQWLEDCKTQGEIAQVKDKHLLIDKEFEKLFSCNLK